MKKTATFIAYLDNGETATVTYESEFTNTHYNTLISCIYKGVEIAPLFKYRHADDSPLGIYQAIENNAKSLWESELVSSY